MKFAEPLAAIALFLAPLVLVLRALGEKRRRAKLSSAGDPELLLSLTVAGRDDGRAVRWVQAGLLTLAMGLVAGALARPQFGMRTEIRRARGMDVVLALDLSRSMLARDVVPSRLERAKIELGALIEEINGDRVGLVGFTSIALPLCPLTVDHSALRLQLDAASPGDLPRGGTAIGGAIEAANRMFEASRSTGAARAIVVITDGEDNEGDPAKAAREAKEAGIEVHVVGVGSRTGEPIPLVGEDGRISGYVKDAAGRTVVSRLDEKTLSAVSTAGGGLLALPGANGGIDLSAVRRHLSTLKKADLEDRTVRVYEERYQWFLAPAFVLLLFATVIRPTRSRVRALIGGVPGPAGLALALAFLARPPSASAGFFDREDPDVKRGNQALLDGRAPEAIEFYDAAKARHGDAPPLLLNRGLAEIAKGELDLAADVLQRALEGSEDPRLRGQAAFTLGNTYRQLRRYDDAVEAYKRALLEDPDLEGARRNLEIARQLALIQPKQPDGGEGGGDPPPAGQDAGPSDAGRDGGQPDGDPQDVGSAGEGRKPKPASKGDAGADDAGTPEGGAGGGEGGGDAGDAGGRPEGRDAAGGEDSGSSESASEQAGGSADAGAGSEAEAREAETSDRQSVEQLLDALEEQEKVLKRKDILKKYGAKKVEKDW